MRCNYFHLNKTIDEIFAILGIVISIALLLYLLLHFYGFVYLLTGILSFLSFTLWLIIRKKASITFNSCYYAHLNKFFLLLFFNIFTLSIISLYYRPLLYERPLIYFVLNSFIVGAITLEIMSFKKKSHCFFILSQIILLGVCLYWSQLSIFPSLVGADPWFHQMVTTNIIDLHYIPSGLSYSKLPLFHLLIAFTSLITGFNYKYATMFSVSLSQIICNALFIFLIARTFYPKNYKICCLAALVLVISNHHIFMSYWSIPNAFAATFIMPIFYILIKLKKRKPLIGAFLSIFFGISLILTHTIVAVFMAIVLFVYWISSFIYGVIYLKKGIMGFKRSIALSSVSITYCVLFSVMMFAWWSYVSGHIQKLATLIAWGFSADYFVNTPVDLISERILSIPVSEQLFNNFAMFAFFSISFIGCLYMISENYGNQLSFNFAIIGITPLVLGYFSMISNTSILEHRWWYFAQITLSIPIALALLLISNMLKKNYLKLAFLVIFLTIISFFMFMNPNSNIDNHIFSPNSSMTYALTSSELQAIESCSNIWDGRIKADAYYANTQKYRFNTKSFDEEIYSKKNELLLKNDLILIRSNILNEPSMAFQSLINSKLDITTRLDSLHFSNIYTVGTVRGYIY